FQVPYEVLNKKFRLAQKSLDREVYHVTNAVSELEKVLLGKDAKKDPAHLSSLIGGVMEKLNSFKRKADEATQDEVECGRVLKRRVEHLKEHNSPSASASAQWKRVRLDRLLSEYLLRAGYYRTAVKLAKENGGVVEGLTNLHIFLVAEEVELALARKDPSRCLAWCHDNKSKLRKMNSTLEFDLRVQEFIELVKKGRRMEAVWHARKYFTNQEEQQMGAVQQCMALLAFPVDTQVAPYKDLFCEERWNRLVDQFRRENLNLFQIAAPSAFSVALQAGLSALKTPHCYRVSTTG
ncbi:UNVERIFIED_CONTAM: hypothetical protein GTU68_010606, partial [Idotea baltica]|nr:hypothetical protein [Idotea baltica]